MYISEGITAVAMWIAFTVLVLFGILSPWWLFVPGVFTAIFWIAGCGRSDVRKCAFSETVKNPGLQ